MTARQNDRHNSEYWSMSTLSIAAPLRWQVQSGYGLGNGAA